MTDLVLALLALAAGAGGVKTGYEFPALIIRRKR